MESRIKIENMKNDERNSVKENLLQLGIRSLWLLAMYGRKDLNEYEPHN